MIGRGRPGDEDDVCGNRVDPRELRASRGAVLAAGCMAVYALLYRRQPPVPSTLDLLVWTVVSWLVVRALRITDAGPASVPAGRGWWLAAGLVAGIGLQNKLQPAFLLAALLVGLLVAGPRAPLRTPWPWAGGLLALLIAAPNLAWQAANGFPQLALSAAIADGSSGSSEPWYLFLPLQLVLISPLLVPVWAVGLGRWPGNRGCCRGARSRWPTCCRASVPAGGAAVLPRWALPGAARCGAQPVGWPARPLRGGVWPCAPSAAPRRRAERAGAASGWPPPDRWIYYDAGNGVWPRLAGHRRAGGTGCRATPGWPC